MGMTIAEKIIARAAGVDQVSGRGHSYSSAGSDDEQ